MASSAMAQVFTTDELVENILLHMDDFQDLFVVRSVSRTFRDTMQKSKSLRCAMLLDSDPSRPDFEINELLSSDLFRPLSFGVSFNNAGTKIWIAAFARPVREWPDIMVDGLLPISAEASWRETRLTSRPFAKVSVAMHNHMVGSEHIHAERQWGFQGVNLFKGETLGDGTLDLTVPFRRLTQQLSWRMGGPHFSRGHDVKTDQEEDAQGEK